MHKHVFSDVIKRLSTSASLALSNLAPVFLLFSGDRCKEIIYAQISETCLEILERSDKFEMLESVEDQNEDETVEMKKEIEDSSMIESIDFDDDEELQDPNGNEQTSSQMKNEDEKEEVFDDGINWASVFNECLDDTEAGSSKLTGNQQSINLYWLDAYEDTFKSPDVVFLFGKVLCQKTKKLVSCCLKITNLERIIFLLPRENRKSDPFKNVTMKDVYVEFDNLTSKLKVRRVKE